MEKLSLYIYFFFNSMVIKTNFKGKRLTSSSKDPQVWSHVGSAFKKFLRISVPFQLKEKTNFLVDFGVRIRVSSASSSVSCIQPLEPPWRNLSLRSPPELKLPSTFWFPEGLKTDK